MNICKVLMYEEPPPPDHVLLKQVDKDIKYKCETVRGSNPLHKDHHTNRIK